MPDAFQSPLPADRLAKLTEVAAGLPPDQLLWASGYLAGLAGGQVPVAAVPAGGPVLTILYGSQTGNGEKLAEKLAEKARGRGYPVSLRNLSDYKKSDLKNERNLLLIMSTHGEGDPPDTALELHEFVYSKRAPKMEGLRYSVLALGDTSYEHFCKTGKDFDEKFSQLGGVAVFPRQDCDVDYDDDAERWMEGSLDAFSDLLTVTSTITVAQPAVISKTSYTAKNPFHAPILERVNLNGRGSAKRTYHIELSLEGSGITYAPGDALGVLPVNRPPLVAELIEQLGASGDLVVNVGEESVTLEAALSTRFEITTLTRPMLQKYADLCGSDQLKQLLADGRHADLVAWTDGRDVLDLLRAYPVTGLSPQALVDSLRKLPPRLYSIASSLAAHPDEVHLTVGVVEYETYGRQRHGVCSNYLYDVSEEVSVPVYVHENRNFRLPADPGTPVIMVGPGTGVAPFRAFLEEREAIGATGPNWLFFGDQHFTTDFLYQIELQKFHKDGLLTRLDVAFSRDQKEKVYVQHRLQEHAAEVFRWLQEGASVYVCGDANRMAPDVHAALADIIAKQGGKSAEDAEAELKQMIKDKRYQRDTY